MQLVQRLYWLFWYDGVTVNDQVFDLALELHPCEDSIDQFFSLFIDHFDALVIVIFLLQGQSVSQQL